MKMKNQRQTTTPPTLSDLLLTKRSWPEFKISSFDSSMSISGSRVAESDRYRTNRDLSHSRRDLSLWVGGVDLRFGSAVLSFDSSRRRWDKEVRVWEWFRERGWEWEERAVEWVKRKRIKKWKSTILIESRIKIIVFDFNITFYTKPFLTSYGRLKQKNFCFASTAVRAFLGFLWS